MVTREISETNYHCFGKLKINFHFLKSTLKINFMTVKHI